MKLLKNFLKKLSSPKPSSRKPNPKNIFFVCISFLAFMGFGPSVFAWNLNDLTYLFPLPELNHEDFAKITPEENSLLPLEIYQILPPAMISREDFAKRAPWFRVVGMRVDPAKNQIRLVWQSIILKTELEARLPEYARPGLKTLHSLSSVALPVSSTYASEDVSLHSFYQLTDSEMKSFHDELLNLKNLGEKQVPKVSTDNLALQVHPGFLSSKFKIEFALTLKTAILHFCNSKTLIQATTTLSTVPEIWWDFAGVVKENDHWKPITIPRLENQIKQSFTSDSMERDLSGIFPIGKRSFVVPLNRSQDNLETALNLFHPYSDADRPIFQEEFKVIRKFQNPKLSNSDNLDCVHCHATESAEVNILQMDPSLKSGFDFSKESYENPNKKRYDLSNHSVANRSTKILRALGYWNAYPVFNQRVINETAESAEFLNRNEKR